MSAREELIVKYAADLKEKCGVNPDMDLLTKVTIGCGPSIYNGKNLPPRASQPTPDPRHRERSADRCRPVPRRAACSRRSARSFFQPSRRR